MNNNKLFSLKTYLETIYEYCVFILKYNLQRIE